MKRHFELLEARDCIRVQPCKFGSKDCRPGSGGSHGIHGEEWRYGVIADDRSWGFVLTVYSGRHLFASQEKASGAHLNIHSIKPWNRGQVTEQAQECPLLGAACYGDAWYLLADEFFSAHGVDQKEQPDTFWAELEKLAIELREDRRPTPYVKCMTCDGTGTVLG